MSVQVFVAGTPLGALGSVSGVEWSSVWSYDGICGDKAASWDWVTDSRPAWLTEGSSVVIKSMGRRRFGGRIGEVVPTDSGFTCHAYGLRTVGADFDAYADADPTSAIDWQPTFVLDTALAAAVTRGLPWLPWNSLSSTPLGVDDEIAVSVETLMLRAARVAGARPVVDQWGIARFLTDPSTPSWLLGGMSDYMGAADDEYVSRMWGRYVSAVDGSGEPTAWATVTAPAQVAGRTLDELKFGAVVERTVDLRALGLLSSSAAQAILNARYALVGGRMGWTSGFAATRSWLAAMNGAQGDPGAIRAGQMIRLAGVRDFKTTGSNRAAADIVIGEARYVVDEDTCYITPMGYVPRDFTSALSAAQKPETADAA